MTFFVSPRGEDSWSGLLAAPNDARTDGPFATITRAQQAVRAQRVADPATPVEVQLRAGFYALTAPLTFTPEIPAPRRRRWSTVPIPAKRRCLSGGVRIGAWRMETVHGHPCWVSDLPEVPAGGWSFTQLFVNGRRAPRPRLPREGYFRFVQVPAPDPHHPWANEGPLQVEFAPGDLHAWTNLRDVEIVALQFWVDKHMYPAHVDEAAHRVTFIAKGASLVDETGKCSRYYVENVFEALDTPGQWYLDRTPASCIICPCRARRRRIRKSSPRAWRRCCTFPAPPRSRYRISCWKG